MPTTTPPPSTSSSHDQFSGVLRFLAPQAHAASPHQHPTATALHSTPAPRPTAVAVHTPPPAIVHPAQVYRTAAQDYPPPGRYYDPRFVNRVAYYQRYAYQPYAYPRYAYPVVAWQPYGYRGYRYVYYYPYSGGSSGY